MTLVIKERIDRTLVLRFNRPEKRNALNREMSEIIEHALDELEADSSLRVGIVSGTESFFSSGSDLGEEIGATHMPRGGEYGLIRRERTKPLIAAVEGFAFGGGFEVALACDMIVASREASFGFPEATRGTLAASGGAFRAPQYLPPMVATELLLTGTPLKAERAFHFGVVNRLAEPGRALETSLKLATKISMSSPASVRATLAIIQQVRRESEKVGWEATAKHFSWLQSQPEMREGIDSFFERRTPNWTTPQE